MKRVLLKLSGEALAGDKKTGFDEATCIGVAKHVFVDGVMQFFFDITETVDDDMTLLLGKMKGFVHLIRKKGIVFDRTA